MASTPLTTEQNEQFDAFVVKWQRTLGLMDWRIERVPGKTKAMADVGMSFEDRLATYRTGNFGESPTPANIESTAVHELLHILLYELVNARSLGFDSTLMTSAEHRVINALEKALMRGAHAGQD